MRGHPLLTQPRLPQEVEARNEMTFSHFIQFYKNLMFDAQKSVRAMACPPEYPLPSAARPPPAKPDPLLCLAGHRAAGALLPLAVSVPGALWLPPQTGFQGSDPLGGQWDRVGGGSGDGSGNGTGNGSRDGTTNRSRKGSRDGKGDGRKDKNWDGRRNGNGSKYEQQRERS